MLPQTYDDHISLAFIRISTTVNTTLFTNLIESFKVKQKPNKNNILFHPIKVMNINHCGGSDKRLFMNILIERIGEVESSKNAII